MYSCACRGEAVQRDASLRLPLKPVPRLATQSAGTDHAAATCGPIQRVLSHILLRWGALQAIIKIHTAAGSTPHIPSECSAEQRLYQKVLAAARHTILETYSLVCREPTAAATEETLRQLPQPVIELLLESSSLAVESEDSVLETAFTWVKAKADGARQRLDLLTRVVLPRIRAPFLSLRGVVFLRERVTDLLEAVSPDQAGNRASHPDAASLEGWSRSAPNMPNPAANFLAAHELLLMLHRLEAAAVPMPRSIPELLRTGAKLMIPRRGYRPPDATITFNPLSHEDCTELRPQFSRQSPADVGDNPKFESAAVACGR